MFGLAVPSTFRAVHSGQHGTWIDKRDNLHRNDYIAIPSSWMQSASSYVSTEMDVVVKRRDHFPLLVQVAPTAAVTDPLPKYRPSLFSRTLMKDDFAIHHFNLNMATFAPPVWGAHVDDHWEATIYNIKAAAEAPFAHPPCAKRARWMSESSWQVLRHRSSMRRSAKQAWLDIAKIIKTWVFASWSKPTCRDMPSEVACLVRAALAHFTMFKLIFTMCWPKATP